MCSEMNKERNKSLTLIATLLTIAIVATTTITYAVFTMLSHKERSADIILIGVNFDLYANQALTVPLAENDIYWQFNNGEATSKDSRLKSQTTNVWVFINYTGLQPLPITLKVNATLPTGFNNFKYVYCADPIGAPTVTQIKNNGETVSVVNRLSSVKFNISYDGTSVEDNGLNFQIAFETSYTTP